MATIREVCQIPVVYRDEKRDNREDPLEYLVEGETVVDGPVVTAEESSCTAADVFSPSQLEQILHFLVDGELPCKILIWRKTVTDDLRSKDCTDCSLSIYLVYDEEHCSHGDVSSVNKMIGFLFSHDILDIPRLQAGHPMYLFKFRDKQ